MAKIRQIKRAVYRKTSNGEMFLKIYKDKKTLIVVPENLFNATEILKSKDDVFYNNKDDKRTYQTARKKEFITAYRAALKAIRL